jgi:hypothetical protein
MTTTHKVDETVKAYFLGRLDDEMASQLEARYFNDPAYLDGLRTQEDSLIAEYLNGHLSQPDRQRFEVKYLTVPVLKARVEEIRAQLGTAPVRRWGFPALRWGAAMAAMALLIATAVWLSRTHSVRQNSAAVPRAPAAVPAFALSVRLFPGVTKGYAAANQGLQAPGPNTPVDLTLVLPGRTAGSTYSVTVLALDASAHSQTTWTSPPSLSRRAGDDGELTVRLPAGILTPGDYTAEVRDDRGEIVESYLFRVMAP